MTPKKTLKKWFSNFMKPAQEHFAAWIDSYWHKDEQIPMKNIEGLSRAIENTASAGQLLNHLDDTNAHHALFEELKRQIQAIQTILQVDDVNLDTLQEIVTELKANTKLQELIDKKVNKEDGKSLSTNDFTNEHKQKLESLQPTDVSGLLPKGGYDGTGQELKDAIDGLQTKIGQVETTLSVDDTAFDTLQEIVTQVKSNKNLETLLTDKVNKEDDKGLSTNDFTNKLKEKLESISPLAGKFLSSNRIISKHNWSYNTEGTYIFDLIAPTENNLLLSFCSSIFGIGKGIDVTFNEETEIIELNSESGSKNYLVRAKGLEGINKMTIKIYVYNNTYPSIENIQLREIYSSPDMEQEFNTDNYAISPKIEGGQCLIVKGKTNIIDSDCSMYIDYIENATFSILKTKNVALSIIEREGKEVIGAQKIVNKVASYINGVCSGDKVYIIVHNIE